VFVGLVVDPPGSGSFARYFLASFRWRLWRVVRSHERRWSPARLVPWREEGDDAADGRDLHAREGAPPPAVAWRGDAHAALAPETALLAADLCLGPGDRRLLRLRAPEDRSVEECAAALGWSGRTAYRRWAAPAA